MKKILSSEITPHLKYLNRRNFIKTASAASIGASTSFPAQALHSGDISQYKKKLDDVISRIFAKM